MKCTFFLLTLYNEYYLHYFNDKTCPKQKSNQVSLSYLNIACIFRINLELYLKCYPLFGPTLSEMLSIVWTQATDSDYYTVILVIFAIILITSKQQI